MPTSALNLSIVSYGHIRVCMHVVLIRWASIELMYRELSQLQTGRQDPQRSLTKVGLEKSSTM